MQIVCSHFNRLALRLLLKPEKFEVPFPIRARPPPKLLSYYTSDEHRGYLSPSYSMLYKSLWQTCTRTAFMCLRTARGDWSDLF